MTALWILAKREVKKRKELFLQVRKFAGLLWNMKKPTNNYTQWYKISKSAQGHRHKGSQGMCSIKAFGKGDFKSLLVFAIKCVTLSLTISSWQLSHHTFCP